MTTYKIHTLPGGMRGVLLAEKSPVVYCGVGIRVGSRHEAVGEHGLAHLCEHMLFKGTARHSGRQLWGSIEQVGGSLDAYTTKEETFFYSCVPAEYFSKAAGVIAEMISSPKFDSGELAKEREVIFDEIESYNDSPAELIYDKFDELLFAGGDLEHGILGERADLERYSSVDLFKFVEKYAPAEMLFFAVGEISEREFLKVFEKNFSFFKTKEKKPTREPLPAYKPQTREEAMETHQAHCLIGARAFSLTDERRLELVFLNNLLGGGAMNSRLNLAIRERGGLAYTVGSDVTAFTDTGVFALYFGCEKNNLNRAKTLAFKELEKLCEKKISPKALEKHKRQFLGQLLIAAQNRENFALSFARSILHFSKFDDQSAIAEKLAKVSAEDLQQIAGEIFDRDNLSTLIFK